MGAVTEIRCRCIGDKSGGRCISGIVPEFVKKKNLFYFKSSCLAATERQGKLLHLPIRTEEAKKYFHYSGCQIYNCFKSMLINFLF